MNTEILKIDHKDSNFDLLTNGINRCARSEPFIFPTETVYGIGCKISDIKSIEKIFELKNRDYSKPMAAHIGNFDQIFELCDEIPDDLAKLSGIYFPGPISVVLKKKRHIPDIITAGYNTIGIRFPDEETFRTISKIIGEPLVASSANISGRKSPTECGEIIKEFGGKVSLIIDAASTKYGCESTVLNLTEKEPILLREGAVSLEEIENVLNRKIKRKM